MSDIPAMGNMSNLPTAAPLSATGVRKAWHEHVTQDLRNHLVHKLLVINSSPTLLVLSLSQLYWIKET